MERGQGEGEALSPLLPSSEPECRLAEGAKGNFVTRVIHPIRKEISL